MSDVLLDVRHLKTYFPIKSGVMQDRRPCHAVEDVPSRSGGRRCSRWSVSGCGSTTGTSVLRLIRPTGGGVLFEGENILGLSAEECESAGAR